MKILVIALFWGCLMSVGGSAIGKHDTTGVVQRATWDSVTKALPQFIRERRSINTLQGFGRDHKREPMPTPQLEERTKRSIGVIQDFERGRNTAPMPFPQLEERVRRNANDIQGLGKDRKKGPMPFPQVEERLKRSVETAHTPISSWKKINNPVKQPNNFLNLGYNRINFHGEKRDDRK